MDGSGEERSLCTPDQTHILLTKENASSHLYSQGDMAVICVIMPIILVVAVLGNGAFLLVIARVEWMRQVSSNIYLACLAVVDISFVAVAVGGRLTRYLASPILSDETVFGVPGCVVIYFASDMCFFVSLFLITLVSFERYTAVCHPFAFRSSTNGRKGLPMVRRITACWVIGTVAACLLIPDRLRWTETCVTWSPPDEFQDLPEVFGGCGSIVDWYFDFSSCVQVVPFFTTMFINLTLYILIARTLYQQASKRRGQSSEMTQEQTRVRDQITRMLIINGTTYFVFLVPFEAIALSVTVTNLSGSPQVLAPDQFALTLNICRCLLYVNSAINPFIYTLTSPAYRRAFMDALCSSRYRGESSQELVNLSSLTKIADLESERRQR